MTAVLTLSTISLDSRTDLPKVKYATALDWFLLMSFLYCIATLLEFAGVHYFTKLGSGEIPRLEEEWEDIGVGGGVAGVLSYGDEAGETAGDTGEASDDSDEAANSDGSDVFHFADHDALQHCELSLPAELNTPAGYAKRNAFSCPIYNVSLIPGSLHTPRSRLTRLPARRTSHSPIRLTSFPSSRRTHRPWSVPRKRSHRLCRACIRCGCASRGIRSSGSSANATLPPRKAFRGVA